MVKRDFTHLTPDEKINGIKASKLPDHIRSKYHGEDVREAIAQSTEMAIQLGINMGLSPDDALSWARKLQEAIPRSEFDSWVATLLDGGPSIFMNTLSELKAAYPKGAAGVALVRETDPAKIYVWNGSAWEDFGDYQGLEIKDGSVTSEKIADNGVGHDKIQEDAIDLTKHVKNGSNSLNLHNIETDREGYTVDLETGEVISTNSWVYLTDFIPINENEQFSSISFHFFIFYNKDKEIISSKYLGENQRNIVYNGLTPEGTRFVRMTYMYNVENTPHINLGGILNKFTPYHDKWDNLTVNGEYLENESVSLNKLSFFEKTTNLLNKKSEILNTGISFTGENAGELISQTDRNTSQLIKCTPNQALIVRGCINLVQYDYRGEYLKYNYFNPADRDNGVVVNLSGKTHSYRVIYANTLPESRLQINEGGELLSWEPYEPIDTNKLYGRASSPLWNKTLLNLGDSIAEAYGMLGYSGQIATKYSMTHYNYGRGGATIRKITSEPTNHTVEQQLDQAITAGIEPDYVIFNGNTNDWGNVSMGEISVDFNSEVNIETYCGAFESVLRKLKTNFPEAKIIYVSAHKMRTRDLEEKTRFTKAAYEICEKYSAPYVDIFGESTMNTFFDNFVGKYTISPTDATHPNELGYEKYYTPLIESKLNAI